jgi:hypothetical protein
MAEIQCFWLEPTDTERVWLRRFTWSEAGRCPQAEYDLGHDAMALLGDFPSSTDVAIDHADPRWPAACVCGYVFTPDDEWETHDRTLYRRADTGELHTLWSGDAPVGAMWNAAYLTPKHAGPDGMCLMVRTPGGDWGMDMPSTQGRPWDRTGTPPNITANPSILIYGANNQPAYHGWLRSGKLIEV